MAVDTLINTLFDGRYRILRRLGSGGMANVYLAEDEDLGRRVAIKILNSRYANDDVFIERFKREARSAASLSHPNIVSIYDRGEAEGTYYIAMEVVEGRSLKELIMTRGPLPVSHAIDYTKQILGALRFAHRHGIVHRDIKPHNVLIDGEGRVKVTDFGIARAGASQMTETGSIIGTAQYLSPEQARGAPVSAASDLYSVGVVLYEMLTGQTPFNGDSAIEVAMKHLGETPKPPSQIRRGLPRELDQVVLRALAKSPEDRYQAADEMAADLARIEAGLPVSTETATAATALLTGMPATAATHILAPDARTRTLPAPPPRRPPPYPPDVEEQPRKRRRLLPWLVPLLLLLATLGAAFLLYDQFQASQTVAVPGVRGLPMRQAVERIENAGLVADVEREPSADTPAGRVFDQEPEGGSRLAKGEQVTVFVSSGPEKTKVPKVVGLDVTAANEKLQKSDLEATSAQVFSQKPVGQVLAQDPPAGAEVAKGANVKLRVSKGPQLVAVPDVLDQSQESAETELRGAGFEVNAVRVENDAAEGLVVAQDPAPGDKAEKGSTVLIQVSQGPQTVAVPKVVGQSRDVAAQRLEAAGFDVDVAEQDTTDPALDGVVLSQQPGGGTQAEPGSTVRIVVGNFVEQPEEPPPPPPPPAAPSPPPGQGQGPPPAPGGP